MTREPSKIRTGPMVLVVDDSPEIRKNVQMLLQQEHIRVVTVSDGLNALTSIADETPGVILLDAQLPGMNGYRICKIIRKNLQFSDIPIVLLRESDRPFDKMRGWLAGVTDYLTKPIDRPELIEMVKKYLRHGPEAMPPRS